MAENSGFWDTNGTGDGGAGGYTEDELRQQLDMLVTSDNTTQAVSKGYKNELAVSGTSSPVDVATGGAIVYGLWYVNDSATTVAVPTPASATRIDRIVLEADWSAQTVRIARVAGTEGGAAPSLTQTAGTIWQVPLAQVSITTGGVITVTDERDYLPGNFEAGAIADGIVTTTKIADGNVTTAKIADGNVTAAKLGSSAVETAKINNSAVTAAKLASNAVETAKIADSNVTTAKIANDAVDDTKVGNRVPQFRRRQGGFSDIWTAPGTTNYTPGAVRMQAGSYQWSGTAASSGTASITFPEAFSNTPLLQVTTKGDATTMVAIAVDGNSSAMTIYWESIDGTTFTSMVFHWLAIGPE